MTKRSPVTRIRTDFDHVIACAPFGSIGLIPRTRYHHVPTSRTPSGSVTDVAGVTFDHVLRHGYDVRESCTSYDEAPTAGSHATSGESCTVGSFEADATIRPSGDRPETHGAPSAVTTGCETFPKTRPKPLSQRSYGTAVSR